MTQIKNISVSKDEVGIHKDFFFIFLLNQFK